MSFSIHQLLILAITQSFLILAITKSFFILGRSPGGPMRMVRFVVVFFLVAISRLPVFAQTGAAASTNAAKPDVMQNAPAPAESQGPFPHLNLRGAIVMHGT